MKSPAICWAFLLDVVLLMERLTFKFRKRMWSQLSMILLVLIQSFKILMDSFL